MHVVRQMEFPFTPFSARLRGITTHLWSHLRSLLPKVSRWVFSSIGKLARLLLNNARSWRTDDLTGVLGTLLGAAAFGWWSQSFAATLFTAIALFFLAGIYKRSDQVLAAITRSGASARFGNEGNRKKGDALEQAIGCLKPWLANEVSLTEENAKECCAVLLSSLAR